MRRRLLTSLTLLLAIAPAAIGAQEPKPADTRPGIAVFPFTNGGSYGESAENLEALSVGIQQLLLTELNQNSALRIVERSALRELMAEQDIGATDRVDASTAARLGGIVGARYVVLGVFIDLNGNFRMDGRIVDVETSEILKTEQVRDDRENLYDLLVELAIKITSGANLPALPAAVREARESREIPAEAITMYMRAQNYEDYGRSEQAIVLYRQIAEEFPVMTEAQDRLRQLTTG